MFQDLFFVRVSRRPPSPLLDRSLALAGAKAHRQDGRRFGSVQRLSWRHRAVRCPLCSRGSGLTYLQQPPPGAIDKPTTAPVPL